LYPEQKLPVAEINNVLILLALILTIQAESKKMSEGGKRDPLVMFVP